MVRPLQWGMKLSLRSLSRIGVRRGHGRKQIFVDVLWTGAGG